MKKFAKQIESIQTENECKSTVIAVNQAYSGYKLSHAQWKTLRDQLIAKRQEKGFKWGEGI